MALLDDIYTMAAVFAAPADDAEQAALRTLCQASADGLRARLRPGLTETDCRESFLCAAAWLALCAHSAGLGADGAASFAAGDLSVSLTGRSAAADALKTQAELLMAPYVEDGFRFRGVQG